MSSEAAPMSWRTVASASKSRANSGEDIEREFTLKLDQARREAYAEGLAVGRQQVEEQFRPAVQELAESLQSLARLREKTRQETLHDLVHLAITVAARVIHREIAVDPDALQGLIQAAFSKLQSREISPVRMHPTLESAVRKVIEQSGKSKTLVLVPDASLKPSDVFFETAQGVLDASVETQLREIERGLADKLER